MRNIVLTGLSGSGKSTLAARIATELGLTRVDLDVVIESEAGMSIPDIFAQRGEAAFRDLETQAALESAKGQDQVIATGGGAVLRPENMEALAKTGLVVFVDRPVERILQDLETEGRPLLKGGAQRLHSMAESRRPLYENTCHVRFANDGPLAEAVPALLALIRGETLGETPCGYAVIGDPIGHSLSPLIHTTVFGALGNQDPYHAMLVERGGLPAFVERVRAAGLKGFNITSPHKKDVIPLLDHVDELALRCGAVNTVVRKGDRLHGYNTDMGGLHLAIQEAGSDYKDKRVLILGTGGAAVGVALQVAQAGATHIAVHGRRTEAVEAVLALVGDQTHTVAGDLSDDALAASAAACDLLINCLPLGMTGTGGDERTFDYLEQLPTGALVVDLIYSPPCTPLLVRAQALGHPILNGLPMLINQALLSDELYLDQKLDRKDLYPLVAKAIEEQQKEETSR